jgi:hypothetical protein
MGMSSFFLLFLLSISTFYGCATQKPQLRASQYRFSYNEEAYRIRSIISDDRSQSYNELVGKDFLAADFDQDRIIDCIMLGEAKLSEVQKIYEYGLDRVTQENKLQVRNPAISRYLHEDNSFQIEMRSFRPTDGRPFNEFRIIDKRQMVAPQPIILVDRNADGTLDEVLKGETSLENAQSHYAEVIEEGLLKGELVKVNGSILVKEK